MYSSLQVGSSLNCVEAIVFAAKTKHSCQTKRKQTAPASTHKTALTKTKKTPHAVPPLYKGAIDCSEHQFQALLPLLRFSSQPTIEEKSQQNPKNKTSKKGRFVNCFS
jgi:hypothetical protein